MGQAAYVVGRFFGKWFYALSIKAEVIRPHIPDRPGGYVLAVSHVSHLEPFIASVLLRRKVDWMARIEFYRNRFARWFLYRFDAFPVNRFGVPISAIRTAIARGRAGRVVGIFPEGGVTAGADSACRGGTIKRGVCLVSMRADIPIIPCVMIGTHTLKEFEPWLPFRRARIFVAFGQPIEPVRDAPTHKAGRAVMAKQLSDAFRALYLELCERYNIPDSFTP